MPFNRDTAKQYSDVASKLSGYARQWVEDGIQDFGAQNVNLIGKKRLTDAVFHAIEKMDGLSPDNDQLFQELNKPLEAFIQNGKQGFIDASKEVMSNTQGRDKTCLSGALALMAESLDIHFSMGRNSCQHRTYIPGRGA